MRFLVLFRDEETTKKMVQLLESPDLAAQVGIAENEISAVGYQCMGDALNFMGLLCMSCPLHRDSDVGLEFILVDDFFQHAFEVKLKFMEALTEDKRFADSNFQYFEKEELSSLLMNQGRADEDEDEDDDEDDDHTTEDDEDDDDDAVTNRLVYLLLDAIAN